MSSLIFQRTVCMLCSATTALSTLCQGRLYLHVLHILNINLTNICLKILLSDDKLFNKVILMLCYVMIKDIRA